MCCITHPAIKEVAIVAMPHERWARRVRVRDPNPGQRNLDRAEPGCVPETVGLAQQKFPERVELVDDLPRTASGKVQKNVCASGLRRSSKAVREALLTVYSCVLRRCTPSRPEKICSNN